ncbi:MAG: hypothetical protein ACRDL8_00630 [Solirubrobacteraceae bacterium]
MSSRAPALRPVPADHEMTADDRARADGWLEAWRLRLARADADTLDALGEQLGARAPHLGHTRYWGAVGEWEARGLAIRMVQPKRRFVA